MEQLLNTGALPGTQALHIPVHFPTRFRLSGRFGVFSVSGDRKVRPQGFGLFLGPKALGCFWAPRLWAISGPQGFGLFLGGLVPEDYKYRGIPTRGLFAVLDVHDGRHADAGTHGTRKM